VLRRGAHQALRQADRTVADPVLSFRPDELIEVEQRLPLQLAGAKSGDARALPQAADVLVVLPEVADLPVVDRACGDTGG
jgi:hypothetical protein